VRNAASDSSPTSPRASSSSRALALCALILQTVQEAVAVVDVGGRIVWCNAAFDQMFGSPRGGSTGLAWAQFADPAQALQRELQSQMLVQAAQSGFHAGHWRGRRADGTLLEIESGVTCVCWRRCAAVDRRAS
jgi:PAS domain S-box-containing protein